MAITNEIRPRAAPATPAGDAKRREFVALDLRTLREGSVPSFDLYIRVRHEFVLYRHRDLPFDAETISALGQNGVTTLYVAGEAAEELAAYCEQHLASILTDRRLSDRERARTAIWVGRGLARAILDDHVKHTALRAKRLAAILAQFVTDEPSTLTRLLNLLGDGSTLELHSANTAIYAVALAQHAPDPSMELVGVLATAGLVHDLGLSLVPPEILAKPGPLSADERRIIQEHPATAEQMLRQSRGFADEVLRAVRCHHERLDGSGYPRRLKSWAIPWTARALAVAEVYDSLTNSQPWRPRMAPVEAVRLMIEDLTPGLDIELIAKFVRMLRSDVEPEEDGAA